VTAKYLVHVQCHAAVAMCGCCPSSLASISDIELREWRRILCLKASVAPDPVVAASPVAEDDPFATNTSPSSSLLLLSLLLRLIVRRLEEHSLISCDCHSHSHCHCYSFERIGIL
jgi:hypothetical protein